MPKVSIIVPVYKAEDYLHEGIGSILSQTFSDFELLLVDDGSPDGSLAICRSYAEKDPRVRVFHQENQGQSAARNLGLANSSAPWICFVDSDDLIHPQMVELLYHAAMETGAGVSMCRMLESATLPEDFFAPRTGRYDHLTVEEQTLTDLFDRGEYPSWVGCAKLIRRELVEGYPYRPGRVYEDNEAVCRWVCRGKTLAMLEEALYFYRSNPVSTTQKAFSLKRLDYLWALESIIGYYGELGYLALRRRFCDLYAQTAADYYRHTLALGHPDAAKGIKRNGKKLFSRIRPTKRQFELLLDAFHPGLIRFYWPVEGVIRTLKESGPSGLLKKAAKWLRKGD